MPNVLKRKQTQQSCDLAPAVEDLKDLTLEAWKACIKTYIRVAAVRVIEPQHSHSYFKSALHDSVEFKKFWDQFETGFSNRQVWRAWTYIRPLVVKYLGETEGKVVKLDKGCANSWLHKLNFVLGKLPKAASDEKPALDISEAQWNRIPAICLNGILDEAVLICGYVEETKKDWAYSDVFAANPQRLISLLA
jgi:hypothetical protein